MKKHKFIVLFVILVIIGVIILAFIKPTKERMIEDFNKNYEVFQSVADYPMEPDGYLNAQRDFLKISISLYDTTDELPEINDEVKRNMNILFFKLRYYHLCKHDDEVTFSMGTVKGIEQGILYLKDDIMPDNIFDFEKIRDHWYFYRILHENQ